MKFALFGLHRGSSTDPDTMIRQARLAEDAGFEALWVGDHIALPRDMGGAAELPRTEALVTLAFLAGITKRVRLGVGVIVLPQRQPVLLAKQLSSLDVLSNGRLTVGVGVGYLEQELRALGVALSERGERTDEFLNAMLDLWRGEAAPFAGQFVSFAGIVERPLPVQQPHPPIVVGGNSPAAYRRAIRIGNGWYGWQLDLHETAQALGMLRAGSERYGRSPELGDLEITITPPGQIDLDTARQYAALGVHRLALQPTATDAANMDTLITVAGDTLIGQI
jgi:probable F420-dependent oxidoreductase